MKKLLLTILTLIMTVAVSAQPRTFCPLDNGWRFHAGDVNGAETTAFDDSGWRTVDLPHDFQIEQPWVAPAADEKADTNDPAANIKSRLSSRGFKEMGCGWYRLSLTPADSLQGRRLLLQFDGILYVADVYLNGERIGGTDYGYVGFEIDVTNRLKPGQKNVIAVRADTREPGNSRWYTGGGIIRPVRLVATNRELYFERHPLYITTQLSSLTSNPSSLTSHVTISAEFTNRGRQKEATIGTKIFSPDGQLVYEGTVKKSRKTASRTMEARLPEIEIARPLLWDTEQPNLYRAVVSLIDADGNVVDETSSTFGIRTVEFGPDFGMKLNGRKVLLKGYANHHSLGALGAAAYPRAIEKRLQLMKQFGVNHIRTSHNPYSREFIELCDKYGILVVDELYDKWTRQHTGGRVPFERLWQSDVPEWVKRDRNSPSVVLWSLGNELQQDPNQPFNDFGVTMYRLMKTLLHRYDSTRLVTVAMHPRYRNWETDSLPCDLAMETDVQAYNYRYMYFPGDGRRFPWMTFYQSEASVAAMGPNFFEMDRDRSIGLAYWGAIDYLGESQGWPAKGWSQGVFYIDLEPKPKAYLMKSMFLPDEPVVHIGIIDKKDDQMWNGIQTGNLGLSDHWNRQPGQKLSLFTFSNADEVELICNGKSLGRKTNPVADPKNRNQIRWNNVEYQPGYLEAVAYSKGRVVARHKIETTGEAVALKAEADAAEGLIHVKVTAVDKKGRRVPTANGEVAFAVDGDARIVGVVNSDITSDEMMTGNKRRLWNGTCTAILLVKNNANPVKLTATASGLKPANIRIPLKK